MNIFLRVNVVNLDLIVLTSNKCASNFDTSLEKVIIFWSLFGLEVSLAKTVACAPRQSNLGLICRRHFCNQRSTPFRSSNTSEHTTRWVSLTHSGLRRPLRPRLQQQAGPTLCRAGRSAAKTKTTFNTPAREGDD